MVLYSPLRPLSKCNWKSLGEYWMAKGKSGRCITDSKLHGGRTNELLLWRMQAHTVLFASGYYQVTSPMIVWPSLFLTVSQINASLEPASRSLAGSYGIGAQPQAVSDLSLCQRQWLCQLCCGGPVTGGHWLLRDFQGHCGTCLPMFTLYLHLPLLTYTSCAPPLFKVK